MAHGVEDGRRARRTPGAPVSCPWTTPGPADREKPFTAAEVATLRPHPGAAQAVRALELARQGRTPHKILGHGVLDYAAALVGTGKQIADTLQA